MAVETRRARLVLPASGTAPARVELEPGPKGERTMRAVAIMATSLVLMPVVFFVPPHILWPVVVLVAGLWLARREWTGAYIVESFEGQCPRCGEPITLASGTRLRDRQRVECYNCHREPELVLDDDRSSSVRPAGP